MSKIDDLIQEFCPDGVEYKPIKKLAEVGTGSSNGNEAQEDGKYPFFIRSQTVKRKNEWEYDEEAIIIPGEGGIGEIYHYVNGKYAIHQRVYRIHFTDNSVDVKFAYHYFRAFFKNFIMRKAVSATVKSIRKPMIEEFMLPVPPLEVQREIVHILDSFTLLTAELTAELTARKKQYEFYRDNLIKKEQHISEVKKLADVANIYDSLHQTPSYSNSGYSMVRVQDIKGGYLDEDKTLKVDESVWNLFTQKYTPRLNDIVVSRVGSYGNFALIPNDKCCLGQNVALIHPNINPKYLYHVLMSTMTKQWINNNVKGASQKSFSLADIKRVPVPVPKENIQQRIAEVLDNFEAICTDLNIGLPAEIEARQKQYEYYRDLLLTFAETGSTLMTDRQTDRQS